MVRAIGKVVSRIVTAFCVSILVASTPVSAAVSDMPGNGSSTHPYLVTSCQQLQDMDSNHGAHYKLMRNIDCSGFGNFNMIGNFYASDPFTGVLDGNHHSIIGLQSNLGGPFGYTNGATIKNLQLKDSTYSISTSIYAGTLIDVASNTTLTNVHSSVVMNGSAPQVGGLIGSASNSTISKSSFTGTIGVTGASINGGLAALFGGSSASISDSYSYGMINGATSVGGLIGRINGSSPSITRSYSVSALGNGIANTGGLVGEINTFSPMTLSNSFSASTMVGSVSSIGGIIGEISGDTPTGTTYYDDTRAGGIGACVGNIPMDPYTTCTTVNIADADPMYFKGNFTNAPMSAWDSSSSGPWMSRTNDYPELRGKNLLLANTFTDANGDTINDLTQGTVNSGTDSRGGRVTFVLGQSAYCINDDSGFWTEGPAYTPADDPKYAVQTSSYWETDIYCRDAGAVIPVTMILDKVYDTTKSVLRHFNTATNTYSTISGATFSTVTINGAPKTAVSYTITEGGPLDPDSTADGYIHDPVALVTDTTAANVTVPGAPNAGVGREYSIFVPVVIAVGVMTILALAVVRRATRRY